MDPNATLRLILEALEDGERDEVVEALENLQTWINHGGHLPDVVEVVTKFAGKFER